MRARENFLPEAHDLLTIGQRTTHGILGSGNDTTAHVECGTVTQLS